MPLSERAHRELVARIQQSFAGNEDIWREHVRQWAKEVAILNEENARKFAAYKNALEQASTDEEREFIPGPQIEQLPLRQANPSESYRFALLAAINDSLIVHDASVVRIEPWPDLPFGKASDDAGGQDEAQGTAPSTDHLRAAAAFGALKERLNELVDEDVPMLGTFLECCSAITAGCAGLSDAVAPPHESADRQNDPPPANALGNVFLSPQDWAKREGIQDQISALEARLRRWRTKNVLSKDFVEPTNRSNREPQFLYAAKVVLPMIDALRAKGKA